MKNPNLPLITAIATAIAVLPYAGCKPQPSALSPEQQQQEIDRQVAQKVAEQKVALQQQQLDQKAQDLAAREQALAQRDQAQAQATPQAVAQPMAQTVAQATPAPQEVAPATTQTAPSSEPVGALTVGSTQTQLDDDANPNVDVTAKTSTAYNRFYTELASQGEWIDSGRYGLVWQPAEARHGDWRPYTAGHWVYARNGTEEMGWTWMTDEPYGWAVYHYGRWTTIPGAGWVWVPGRKWAPAWVSWRTTPDHVGWAPLPPETGMRVGFTIGASVDEDCGIAAAAYAFVAVASLGDSDMRVALVPRAQTEVLVNNSTNVTNITTVNNVNNTTIVNNGPSFAKVSAASRKPVSVVSYAHSAGGPGRQTMKAGAQGITVPAAMLTRQAGPVHLPTVTRHLSAPAPTRGTWGTKTPTGAPSHMQPMAAPEHRSVPAPAGAHIPADVHTPSADVHPHPKAHTPSADIHPSAKAHTPSADIHPSARAHTPSADVHPQASTHGPGGNPGGQPAAHKASPTPTPRK